MKLLPQTRAGALWRFALGAFIVVMFVAATTAVGGLLQFRQIAKYISANPALSRTQVTIANPGNPQTLLLVGSDHRAGTPYSSANTDTMMLVRIDPSSSTINVLSLPRDLEVQIPGYGTNKLNSAYSIGGTSLLVRTIKQNIIPSLAINHVVDVNFGGFSKLVNAIGCVYTDVDQRYYNNTAVTDYSSIDIEPGYQKLCGTDALAFVRFRHTDNDIVRNARQQDFLRWAKDQYTESSLISQRDQLMAIFGANTQTDANLHSVDGLINLFNLVAFSSGHAIKQIPFPAIIQPCGGPPPGASSQVQQTPCYVTATPDAEARAYTALMTPTQPQPAAPAGSPSATRAKPHAGGPPPGLTSDLRDGQAQGGALSGAGMPIYAPSLIMAGSNYCTPESTTCTVEEGQTPAQIGVPSGYPRAYLLRDQSGKSYYAYRMTISINPLLGEYYGVQGTAWQNPPILSSPTETRSVNGKNLMLFFNGRQLTLVAWRTPQGVYWISNSLTSTIGSQQMIAMAASLTRVR